MSAARFPELAGDHAHAFPLTFGPRPLCADYALRAPAIGRDAMADPQLDGLMMWVPGVLRYLVVGPWLLFLWLARFECRATAATATGNDAP